MRDNEFEVTLDRSWYPYQFEAYDWLREEFGDWRTEPPRYKVTQMFGYTHVEFTNQEDADKFRAWVEAQVLADIQDE